MSNRGTGRGIPAKDYKPLRKPGESRSNHDGGKGNGDLGSPILSSNQSSSDVTNGQLAAGVSNMILTSTPLNVNAAEFVPREYVTTRVTKPQTQSSGPDSKVIEYVKEILDRLTKSPGEFDVCVEDLVLAWHARADDADTLNEMARVIMEQAILEPNFTYTGARISDFIANKTDKFADGKTFRNVFLTRCSEEHRKREEMLKNQQTLARVHGLAMFLAELFCTFRFEGKTEPVEVLGRALLEMLMSLIEHGTDDSLLYAGRILKLTGYLLDDPKNYKQDNTDNKVKVTKIFADIAALSQPSSGVGPSVKTFLLSVINLRKSKWGQESFDERAATSVTTSVLSADAKPFEYTYYGTETNPAIPYYNPNPDECYSNNDDYYLNNDDDITPVTNPDQWIDYCGDDDNPIDSGFQYYSPNENYNDVQVDNDEDDAFTEEMQRDFDLFMSEQQQP